MPESFHSFCVAGVHSGVGKTTITLGLLTALSRRGLQIQPFKCGPDYIDGEYHKEASGIISRNLDTWMMGEEGVKSSYGNAVCENVSVAVIEGVMGLFDGAFSDLIEGSTAHVAMLVKSPVILVVNAKAMARSIAALVKGFTEFEKEVRIVGIIANNVSSEKHADILINALKSVNLPPLLGFLPHNDSCSIPERHLGLISNTENKHLKNWYEKLADNIEKHIDIDRLLELTVSERPGKPKTRKKKSSSTVRLGVAIDEAFHFYYEDNLDLLKTYGAELVLFSPLHDKNLPKNIDGLYIGGGFPEMFAEQLEENNSMRICLHEFYKKNGYIYAECGGLMYLSESITDGNNNIYLMSGVLPVKIQMESRRRMLGYIDARTVNSGIFGDTDTFLRGHEFHWSSITSKKEKIEYMYMAGKPRQSESEMSLCGIHIGNVWASYIHIHFASNPKACENWVKSMAIQ